MSVEKRAEAIVVLADKAPPALKPYLKKAAPMIAKIITVGEQCVPYVTLAYTKCLAAYELIQPYHPEDFLPILAGLVMCFFGGVFPLLIAAIEAFRMTGYETLVSGCSQIYKELKLVHHKSVNDDKVDADGDGVPDVQQISVETLITRKLALAAAAVEPEQLNAAIVGITASCLGVLATLKLQFARAITLGASIGEVLRKPATKYASPALKKFLPEEYHKWAPLVVDYAVKTVAISVAWAVQRVISACHSAIRGGHLAGATIVNVLHKRGLISFNDAESNLDEIAGYVLAAFGLLFQIKRGFSLPFPVNVLLLPVSLLEWFTQWLVSS